MPKTDCRRSSISHWLAAFVLACLVWTSHANAAASEDSGFAVEPGGFGTVVVRIKAATSHGTAPKLVTVAPGDITTSVVGAAYDSDSKAWTYAVKVSADDGFANQGLVAFSAVGGLKTSPDQIMVKPAPVPRAADVATMELYIDADTMSEGPPTQIFVKVSNLSDEELALKDLHFSGAAGFTFSLAAPIPATVAPHSIFVATETVQMTGAEIVGTGNHAILATLDVSRPGRNPAWKGSISAEKQVTVGVLGMSDLLKLLQIPSFLFLPGFLMVATYKALRAFQTRKSPTPEKDVQISDLLAPGMLVISVTLSGAMAGLYPLVTKRQILFGYSLTDVVYVWAASIIAGYAVATAVELVLDARDKSLARSRFVVGEAPLPFLERLRRMKISQIRPFINYMPNRLLYLSGNSDNIWVAPEIFVKGVGTYDTTPIDEAVSLEKDEEVIELIKAAVAAGGVTVEWSTCDDRTSPIQVPAGTYTKFQAGEKAPLIKVE